MLNSPFATSLKFYAYNPNGVRDQAGIQTKKQHPRVLDISILVPLAPFKEIWIQILSAKFQNLPEEMLE